MLRSQRFATIMRFVICSLCGTRRAKRACPALGVSICAVCCGTKRLTEIQCPSDCSYLASAREHPPATALRQQQRELEMVAGLVRDLNERQSQLFYLTAMSLLRYQPPQFQPLIDDEIAEAAAAVAGTLETSVRGVIYEHRAASQSADRLAGALKQMLAEAGKSGGTSFERDAAVVLRRIEQAARDAGTLEPGNRRALLDLLTRFIRPAEKEADSAANRAADAPRLIVP